MKTLRREDEQFQFIPFFSVELGPPPLLRDHRRKRSFDLADWRVVTAIEVMSSAATISDHVAAVRRVLGVEGFRAADLVLGLMEGKLLVPVKEREREAALLAPWFDHEWGEAARLHCETRNLRFADEDGAGDYGALTQDRDPPPFNLYFNAIRTVPLSADAPLPSRSFIEVALARRTNKPWKSFPLGLIELSSILNFATTKSRTLRSRGESQWRHDPKTLMETTSCVFETLVVVNDVDGLEQGVYHHNLDNMSLDLIHQGTAADELLTICAGQQAVNGSKCAFLLLAVWERQFFRYRHSRGYRNLFVSAGELAHRYVLLATAFGRSTFITPGVNEAAVEQFLDASRYEQNIVYVVAVG